MPFDMNPVDPDIDQLARMRLLGEIAAETDGSQGSFRTCLWSQVRKRGSKTRALVKDFDDGAGNAPTDTRRAAVALGFGEFDSWLWSAASITEKRALINRKIEGKEADIADKTQKQAKQMETV